MENFEKIYEGSAISAQQLIKALEEHKIEPVVRDETESGRLAGFAPTIVNNVQVFVHKDELAVSKFILKTLEGENV